MTYPWLRRVEVNPLDPLAPGEELALQVQLHVSRHSHHMILG